jgi:hypothetical protein
MSMKVDLTGADATTVEFANDVFDLIDSTNTLRRDRGMKAAMQIIQAIHDRDPDQLSWVPVDQVHLTDRQWEQLESQAKFQLATFLAED